MLLSAMERAGSDSYDDDDDVEKKGLGTPATRAAIIETLVKRQYVERKGKQLIPTDKGIRVIDVVPEKVKSAAMTAEWESTLQKIAKGRSGRSAVPERYNRVHEAAYQGERGRDLAKRKSVPVLKTYCDRQVPELRKERLRVSEVLFLRGQPRRVRILFSAGDMGQGGQRDPGEAYT